MIVKCRGRVKHYEFDSLFKVQLFLTSIRTVGYCRQWRNGLNTSRTPQRSLPWKFDPQVSQSALTVVSLIQPRVT